MKIEEATGFIREKTDLSPSVGLLLRESIEGKHLKLSDRVEMSFSEIPHFRDSSITDRHLRLIIGKHEGNTPIALMTGRLHYYEGFSMEEIVFPFRVLMELGVKYFIITNAVGLLSDRGKVGDVMVVKDHINLMGVSPLRGQEVGDKSELHPVMKSVYPDELQEIAREVLGEMNISHFSGVYVGVSGPAYETGAEAMMYEKLGGDVVGMSLVPEVQTIKRYGGEVLALSIITNIAGGDAVDDEVNLLVGGIRKQLLELISEIMKKMIVEEIV